MVCWMMERLVFLFLLEEPHSEGSCEIRFVGKVIEMSEKEPGSLETQGSFKCQGSSSNIPLYFRDSRGCWGSRNKIFFGFRKFGCAVSDGVIKH